MHNKLLTTVLLATLVLALGTGAKRPAAKGARKDAQAGMTVRARVLKLTPEQPARIQYRWGGEGLGGDVQSGEMTAVKPKVAVPTQGNLIGPEDGGDFELEPNADEPSDRIIVEGKTVNLHYLKPGTWSPSKSISVFGSNFITFTLEGHQSQNIRDAEIELEFSYNGEPFKNFTVSGPDGPTFGVFIPRRLLGKDQSPTPEFTAALGSLRDYVEAKYAALQKHDFIQRPTPKLYGFVTDCAGYKPGKGYGCRTTDRETILTELRILHAIGLNGSRGIAGFFLDWVKKKKDLGAHFGRTCFTHTMGYPIPSIGKADGRAPTRRKNDGCPFHPDNLKNLDQRCAAAAAEVVEEFREFPYTEIWALTVDEIGNLFGGANEGTAHLGCCPYCIEGFQAMLKEQGLTPADFGATSWQPIRPTTGYWAISYWESERILKERLAQAEAGFNSDMQKNLTGGSGGLLDDRAAAVDLADDVLAAPDAKKGSNAGGAEGFSSQIQKLKQQLHDLSWSSKILYVPEEERKLEVSERGWKLLEFHTRNFINYCSGRAFTPLRDAFAEQNRKRAEAIAAGRLDSPEAKQPVIYSYALRGNNFLMGGHSLDFFDFYRHADNAFIYETSNRDPRVWQWDSYLCDVGRTLDLRLGKAFGIYVKPHRGAPIQRALAAVARNVRLIYWYTYGPEWHKGDTFGADTALLGRLAWCERLIAEAEEVTWESEWAVKPQVAVVRTRTGEFFSSANSWENGKWVYTALQHAHIPVDALDEEFLLTADLSAYRIIYISGAHVQRRVAQRLAKYVEDGGILYTSGWGMARDEANEPLDDILLPVFGLKQRGYMHNWGNTSKYGATKLAGISKKEDTPAGSAVQGTAVLQGQFQPAAGREVLLPLDGAEVLARYADGGVAAVRHRHGKGQAILVGTYAGLEYASDIMTEDWRATGYNPDKRSWVAAPALDAGIRPAVDASDPLVEGVLLRQPKDGRLAAVLVNWDFSEGRTAATRKDLTVKFSQAGPQAKVWSTALQQEFPMRKDGDRHAITLPEIAEGDILLLR